MNNNNSTNPAMSTNSPKEQNNDVEQIILVVFSFIFLFIGVLGNSAVIIYNIFLNNDKTPSSWLVTHLAVADLFVSSIIYPTKIVRFFFGIAKKLVLCKISRTVLYVSLFLSIMILLSITIDKYLYISKPLRYPLIVRTRRTKIFLGCIWLTALVQLAPIYIYTMQKFKKGKCVLPPPVVWLQVILQLAAICVMAMLNYKMFKIVKQQRQRIALEFVLQPQQSEDADPRKNITWLRHLAKELKAVKTFAIIVGIMTFCFIPYIVINMLIASKYRGWLSEILVKIAFQLVGINSIANAFIYALRHKKYIKAYRKLFNSARARLFHQNTRLTQGLGFIYRN